MDLIELLNIQNAFHQGQYQQVVDFDTSSLSTENALPARVLKLRARIALGQAKAVISEITSDSEPDLAAVKAFALYIQGSTAEAEKASEKLVLAFPENATVQLLGGTILQATGRSEEALSLLSHHEGSLEAVALVVQIQLQQNRTDLALKEVQSARKWAQDSLLFNIAESWVGLRIGGEKYQQAFYVFEEMPQVPASNATKALVSQAVAEIHLGRLPEAEAVLQKASQSNPEDVEAIANTIVLNTLAGKESVELMK